jgi:rod shape-determining protein MreD
MIMPRSADQLLMPVNPLFVWTTLFVAFAFNLVPVGRIPAMPDFLALVLVFWNVHQSRRIGVGVAFIFGLLMDVHSGAVLGQHALAYTLLSFFAITVHRRLLWFFVFAVVLAFVANEIGWVAAEVGRQPWSVYPTLVDGQVVGGLLTKNAVSEHQALKLVHVLGSILMFVVIYGLLFAVWIYVLNHKIQQGPEYPAAEGIPAGPTSPDDLLATASRRVEHTDSMTEAKEK